MKMETQIQNLWEVVRAVLRGKFIAINTYIKKKIKTLNKQPNFIPQGTRKKNKLSPKLIEGRK